MHPIRAHRLGIELLSNCGTIGNLKEVPTAVPAREQPPLAAVVTVLCSHGLSGRMRCHNVCVPLLIQCLELIAELEMIDHADDLRRHFFGVVGTAHGIGTDVPAKSFYL